MPIPTPKTGESQNDFVSRCISTVKKIDPNRPDKQVQAICFNSWRKKKENYVAEDTKDWHVLEFYAPLEITEKSGDNNFLMIAGTAINETVTRNGYKYEAKELTKSAGSLINKPILKDHKAEVDQIVGKITEANFENGGIQFKGKVMDSKVKEMINDGRIDNVSIGAQVKNIRREKDKDTGEEYGVVEGIDFTELSFVAVPGDPGANVGHAFEESLRIKESLGEHQELKKRKEELKMAEEEKQPIEKPAEKAPVEEPKKEEKTEEKPAEEKKETEELLSELKKLREEVSKLKEVKKTTEKAKPKSVVKETVNENKNDDLIFEHSRNGMSFWRMPGKTGRLR